MKFRSQYRRPLRPPEEAVLQEGRRVDKGISGVGIGSGVWIGGPTPCGAGPGTAGATITGSLRSEKPRVGGSAGGAGRVVLRAKAAEVWRESDGEVQ